LTLMLTPEVGRMPEQRFFLPNSKALALLRELSRTEKRPVRAILLDALEAYAAEIGHATSSEIAPKPVVPRYPES
jgi:hypothetical protein